MWTAEHSGGWCLQPSSLPPLPPGSAGVETGARVQGRRQKRFSIAEKAALHPGRPLARDIGAAAVRHLSAELERSGRSQRMLRSGLSSGGAASELGTGADGTKVDRSEYERSGRASSFSADVDVLGMSRSASAPAIGICEGTASEADDQASCDLSVSAQGLAPSGSLQSPSPDLRFNQSQVRAVLERLLPTGRDNVAKARYGLFSLPGEQRTGAAGAQGGAQGGGAWSSRPPTPERIASMPSTLPLVGAVAQSPQPSCGASMSGSPTPSWSPPSRGASPPVCSDGSRGLLGGTRSGRRASSRGQRFPPDALDRFRLRLLKRHESVHEAFSRHSSRVSFERLLGTQEFRHALFRLVEDETHVDELFASMSASWTGTMSLSALLGDLMGASPTAPLWELRCRLVHHGLWPLESQIPKALGLLGRKQLQLPEGVDTQEETESAPNGYGGSSGSRSGPRPMATMATTTVPCTAVRQARPELPETLVELLWPQRPAPKESHQLSQEQWLNLCSILGLVASEARRLSSMLGNGHNDPLIDLFVVARALGAIVSPDISLRCFVTRLIDKYVSLRDAFEFASASSSYHKHKLRSRQFVKLARTVGVSSSSAEKLWEALTSTLLGTCPQPPENLRSTPIQQDRPSDTAAIQEEPYSEGCDSHFGLSQQEFVSQMLQWGAPEKTLGNLRQQLCESFGSLHEGRKALRQQGLPGSWSLSPRRFREGLCAAGVGNCDADVVLHLVRRSRDARPVSRVTLDDVIEAMREEQWAASKQSELDPVFDVVKSGTVPLWRQLDAMRSDLSQSCFERQPGTRHRNMHSEEGRGGRAAREDGSQLSLDRKGCSRPCSRPGHVGSISQLGASSSRAPSRASTCGSGGSRVSSRASSRGVSTGCLEAEATREASAKADASTAAIPRVRAFVAGQQGVVQPSSCSRTPGMARSWSRPKSHKG
ncbi:unnamed protein product [Polarella glacialis]|uniref:Uncharacterized protein n=1 Tax=Polarella glacialis TaxID=89957 RepID=A0A813JPK2_POLGL|nr:unnamed protein product [Polarella glacialis]